ncbi:MAG: TetR/AcrR family transcriptional regulator [Novosphingobium sp.]|nr:TetR/AcrR family transcriptional regulator [Novosphingobium sp.]
MASNYHWMRILCYEVERKLVGQSKSRPDDARARKSRAALRVALLQLVETEPFERISIRELCRTARVSHPTFYRNYESKEEILAEIAEEEVNRLWSGMLELVVFRDPEKSARAICNYVHRHRGIWKPLVTTSAATVLRDKYVELSVNLRQTRKVIHADFPIRMVSAVFAAGMIEILSWWLNQPEDYPVDNVVQFLSWLVVNPTIGPATFKLRSS